MAPRRSRSARSAQLGPAARLRRRLLTSRPRFLFAGTEVPALGGASTALYDLFHRALGDGHDVHLVSILEEQDSVFFQYTFGTEFANPRGLPQTSVVWIDGNRTRQRQAVGAHIERVDPDVLVGFGFGATRLLHQAAPARPLAFVTASCHQAAEYVMTGRAKDAIDVGRILASAAMPPAPVHDGERQAVGHADLVIAHSPQTLAMMQAFFPLSAGKIYPDEISFAGWIREGALPWRDRARPFDERDIDALFIATDWDRPVKNYAFVEAIVRAAPDVSVHVVGDVPRPIEGATHHGFVAERSRLFDLLGRARALVSPSIIDAAPGVLVEASVMGCNLVASKNCGNWEICHPDLLVDPFRPDVFAAAVRRARERRHGDRLEVLLARPGYPDLVAVLTAFARPFGSLSLP